MLFVCLFDLISSGSGKNDNLWKSLGDIVVNRTPRELLNGLPREYIEGPLGIFFWQTLCRILGQTLGQKPSGPAAPWVFGLGSGLGCGLGFAFGKSLGWPSIYP